MGEIQRVSPASRCTLQGFTKVHAAAVCRMSHVRAPTTGVVTHASQKVVGKAFTYPQLPWRHGCRRVLWQRSFTDMNGNHVCVGRFCVRSKARCVDAIVSASRNKKASARGARVRTSLVPASS